MVLHGKEKAIEEIFKSSTAFIGRALNVQRRFSSLSMPPIDHYTLEFDQNQIKVVRGRVYQTMNQFDYAQRGEGICAASNDLHRGIRKKTIRVPTNNELYVVCLNGNPREISNLIEINRFDVDEILKRFA